jgi:hypothetical protein
MHGMIVSVLAMVADEVEGFLFLHRSIAMHARQKLRSNSCAGLHGAAPGQQLGAATPRFGHFCIASRHGAADHVSTYVREAEHDGCTTGGIICERGPLPKP